MKRVVILQSSYIPWKGYFDLMARCDEFILFDDTQFTRRDWRSRNRIKTAQGPLWLTIPVMSKGKFNQFIQDVTVADPTWTEQHWTTIRHAYKKAPHFAALEGEIAALYEAAGKETFLSAINYTFIRGICRLLGIPTRLTYSREYPGEQKKAARLIEICKLARATHYLSGPAARAYIEPQEFESAGITLEYMSYDGYLQYPQLWGDFMHEVSILDLLFNTGPDASRWMLSKWQPTSKVTEWL
jgi:hypothetical protein